MLFSQKIFLNMTYFLTQDKLYLYVPFSQKDEAKEKGAKYDPDLKLWYLPPVKDPLEVEQFWAFLEIEVYANHIPQKSANII